MSKFRTEIGDDFNIERHEDYTVIGPMRFYTDENKGKKYRNVTITADEFSEICGKFGPDANYKALIVLGVVIAIGILLYVLAPIIIAIERYYGINV